MTKFQAMFASLALVAIMVCTGCGPTEPAATPTDQTPAAENGQDNAATPEASGESGESGITAAIAKLPADQQEAAKAQKYCPVSGQLLGEMGTPIAVDVNGKTVFICCEGCRAPLLADPDKYLDDKTNDGQ